jgi:hypothetical protein
MIDIESGLLIKLSADTNSLVAGRVYPLMLPQTCTFPAITYQRISSPRVHSHQGASGLAYPRFQINVYASTFASVKAILKLIRIGLDGYKGTIGTSPNTVKVGCSLIENELDDYDPQSQLYYSSQDYIIWHDEALS